MNDPYPTTLTIEIDRPRLRRYLRVKWLLAWASPLCAIGGIAWAPLSLAFAQKAAQPQSLPLYDAILTLAAGGATGAAGAFLLAFTLYLIRSHRLAARFAETLQLTVEGDFLRYRENADVLLDRKLHFRSIVDYAIAQDSLMRRMGIHALQMTIAAGPGLAIAGVKDCERIRDMLAEIDRLRENH